MVKMVGEWLPIPSADARNPILPYLERNLKQISTIFTIQHGTINLAPTLPKPPSVLTSLSISTLRRKQGGRAGLPSRTTTRVPWLFRFLQAIGRIAILSLALLCTQVSNDWEAHVKLELPEAYYHLSKLQDSSL